jgi:hypothetical protein
VRWDGAVPKYDAFGREIGEDTLSGLGSGASSPAPASEPAPAPGPVAGPADGWTEPSGAEAPSAAAPQPTFTVQTAIPGARRRRGTSGFGCLIGLVVLAAIVAGPVIAIVSFVGEADDAIDGVRGVIDGATTIDAPEEAGPPPRGLAGASMVGAGNFREALQTLRAEDLRKLSYIRVEPERLDTQAVTGGKLRNVQIRYDGEVSAPPASPGTASSTFALGSVDPDAPARLVRAAAKRARLPVRRIDYLVATDGPGGHRWLAYFENGPFAEGDRRGRLVRLTPR